MAVKRYAGDKLVGLSSDTKPTNIPDGATFYETDTYAIYLKTAGIWNLIVLGPIGYTGSQGGLGYTGSQGPIGYTGSQGVIGYSGSLGYTGSEGFTRVTYSSTEPVAPEAGDIWINADTGLQYTYIVDNDSSQWVELGNPGSIGYTGSKGDIGYTGSQGDIGYTGSQGVIGYTGSQGPIGYTGSQGPIGYTGSQGVIGYSGSLGYTGSVGKTAPRSITIETPSNSEKVPMFWTNTAITVTEIRSAVIGSSTPYVNFSLRFGSDLSAAGTEIVTGGVNANSTTTGISTVSFNNATISANAFVWLTTTATGGTVNSLHVSMLY
jgi:Collagen triple helix repeat (20 copies)